MKKLLIVTLLFCGLTAKAAAPTPDDKIDILWQRLGAQIGEIEEGLDGVMGVAILDLASGRQFVLHGDDVFPQASSIKITVLAELYHQAEQNAPGKAKLSDLYTVQANDLVADSDILGGLTPGVSIITNHDLATMMIAVSDNSATNVLIDRVGMANVATLMESQGLKQTKLRRKMMDLKAAAEGRENISTPREMMTLLAALYRGQILGQKYRDDFFTMLATHKNSYIPRGLPADLKIADKPGELEGVRNDSGVVFLKDRPYVICVMTTYLGSEKAGEEAITKVSQAAFNLFDRLSRASEYGRVISPGNGGVR